jgi:glycogen debranching enzyme
MGDRVLAAVVPDGLAQDDLEVVRGALAVLESNWLGHATRPARDLYPHQWSWDSACIAVGYSHVAQERAQQELRSLFAGQWRNGLLPHIVFVEGAHYFPGPEFWQTERSADAPSRPRTSGIVQPPVHATAALIVHRHARDRESATAFLRELYPKLAAWHEYLYRERDRDGIGLAETWHPWESGMDNSPLWDDALARIVPAESEIPEYTRTDVELAVPAERPTDADYDRYAYLVRLFRDLDYAPATIRAATPFAIQPVIFNALLVQSGRDLAEIARIVGDDPAPHEEHADLTAAAIDARLWNEEQAIYLDLDVRAGAQIRTPSGAGFAPLHAGVPSPERAGRMVAAMGSRGVSVNGGWAVTSLPPGDPRFEPTLYWRGPIWPIHNWVLHRGLLRYGYGERAEAVRSALVELSRRSGFWEHYSPATGHGHGGEACSWTAGLVLDLVCSKDGDSRPADAGT